MAENTENVPRLVDLYVTKIGPYTKGKPAQWGEAWVKGTKVFGWQLVAAGAITFALAWPHNDPAWTAVLATLGAITVFVGAWHLRNAERINQVGLMRTPGGDGSGTG